MQTLTSRGIGDAAAGLGLHILHMSVGPFSHDAGHMVVLDRYDSIKSCKSLHLHNELCHVNLQNISVKFLT